MDMSTFARTIMEQKYSHILPDGTKESWEDIAKRVVKHVMRAVYASRGTCERIEKLIAERKFLPGGRYLYAAGRPYHQVQNCLLLKVEDSREGWADLMSKATLALMTGAGIGVDYSAVRAEGKPIRKTGGIATGPIALMQMLNEAGRGVMQGGSRRSAIWAGLSWKHADIHKFIQLKNWSPEVRKLKEMDFNFPATMDGTNISVQLDDEFFLAYGDEKHKHHSLAHGVYWATIRQMLKTAEPGFSIDTDANAGETLRNAPVSGDTYVLTNDGYMQVNDIVGKPTRIWTGKRWAEDVEFVCTQKNAEIVQVNLSGGRMIKCEPSHEFFIERYEGKLRKLEAIEKVAAHDLEPGDICYTSYPEYSSLDFNSTTYTLGWIYGDGSFSKKYPRAELTLCTDEKKACMEYMNLDLTTSITHEDNRGHTRIYFGNNALFVGCDKELLHEGIYGYTPDRAASFIAGLFDADGSYDAKYQRVRLSSVHRDFLRDVARLLEMLGIRANINVGSKGNYPGSSASWMLVVCSEDVCKFGKMIPTKRLAIDAEGYEAYRAAKIVVESVDRLEEREDVYCCDVKYAEHSFMAEGVILSNCTEVTSHDDSDICNLGSINLARISSLEEMEAVVELGTAFLLAGTLYSDVPYAKVDQVRTKNRRLGLGIMGIHEWLAARGKTYGPDEELQKYLEIYSRSTDIAAKWAQEWEISAPVKTRAIAPTGTIGIVAETTTGIEPIFCAAYKRRYAKGATWAYQYVLDPTAKRLVDAGANPDNIEDAYTIAENVERRVAFQAWVQAYVDHSISSTINLPSWGSELNNDATVSSFGNMLIQYLPKLRGITCYPDGARGGQPLNPVRYATAAKHVGEVFIEQADICEIGKGGSCGS